MMITAQGEAMGCAVSAKSRKEIAIISEYQEKIKQLERPEKMDPGRSEKVGKE